MSGKGSWLSAQGQSGSIRVAVADDDGQSELHAADKAPCVTSLEDTADGFVGETGVTDLKLHAGISVHAPDSVGKPFGPENDLAVAPSGGGFKISLGNQ